MAGIGPGSEDFITPAARLAIENAKILVGGRRALNQFATENQITFPITADIKSAVDFIRAHLETSDVVVPVSGDPGYYSMLDTLRREFDCDQLEVIPSISAMQLAFAKAKMPWHDATLLSFHGRRPDDRELYYRKNRVLGLLTDGAFNSQTIAEILIANGWEAATKMFICARLSYADEKIIRTTLADAVKNDPIKHCVLIIGGGDGD